MKKSNCEAPTIETERTILRPHHRSDFEAYAAMQADPAMMRFVGGTVRTREESWLRFLRHPGLWSMLGFGYFAVEDRATGAFIGEAGFHDMLRDMTPSIEGLPEAGWSLAGAVHGRGIATEVVRAMLAWSDANLPHEGTVCIIDVDHEVSMRLAKRAGYLQDGEALYKGNVVRLFRRPRGANPAIG